MSTKKAKALIIGDYTDAPYHPLKGIDNILTNIISDSFESTCTEDRSILSSCILKTFKLCISYFDSWDKELEQKHISGLLTFASQGGGILIIHNGISYQKNVEFAQLVGAKFTGHPPYQRLQYKVTQHSHPITGGIQNFEMDEELYMFDFDNFCDLTALIQCTNNEVSSPAAWVRRYGLGLIAYLAPGHDAKSFENYEFQELIKRSALWVAGLL